VDGNVVLEWLVADDLDFPMPLPVRINGEMSRVEFSDNRATLNNVAKADILIDPDMAILRKTDAVPTCEERRAEEAEKAAH
jgi:hypothetical protein